jgi:hypothetical protein
MTRILQKLFRHAFRHASRHIHDKGSLTIMTGANAPFFDPLITCLLPSIERFEPNAYLYIWDLGFTSDQVDYLNDWFLKTKHKGGLRKFPFGELPNHYNMSGRTYAFKSYCIYNTIKKNETDYYVWLDTKCVLRDALFPERNLMRLYGFYSPYSSTNIKQLTYPNVLSEFCEDLCHYGDKQMLSAGVICFSIHCTESVALITEWYNHTFQERLIAPVGSNRTNHRQDQSLLSLCYYSRYDKVPLLARRFYHVLPHMYKG